MNFDLESHFDVLYERNGESRICCPFCGDDEGYHLYINEQKGVYHCFRCDAKGSMLSFIRKFKIKDVPSVYQEFNHRDVQTAVQGSPTPVATELTVHLEDFKPITGSAQSLTNPYYLYLRNRGLHDSDIDYYRLHYAPQGKYRFRVVFPCFEAGQFVYFTARTILQNAEIRRYLNPPKGLTPMTRAEVVFNLDGLNEESSCIIMEGALNAMITGRDAVATFGKFVSPLQLAKLLGKHCKEYVVALDDDAIAQSLDLCKKLLSYGQHVRLALFPKKQDAANLGRDRTRQILDDAEVVTQYSLPKKLIAYGITF